MVQNNKNNKKNNNKRQNKQIFTDIVDTLFNQSTHMWILQTVVLKNALYKACVFLFK